jgi:hypothetical protein
MKFSEAYESIDRRLDNYQTDWSAQGEGGVAISIWWAEIGFKNGRPYFDTRELNRSDTPETDQRHGSRKRKKHLQTSLRDFGGWVDAIILMGTPGKGYGSAEPWDANKCGGCWKITSFDESTGHFVVELVSNQLQASVS